MNHNTVTAYRQLGALLISLQDQQKLPTTDICRAIGMAFGMVTTPGRAQTTLTVEEAQAARDGYAWALTYAADECADGTRAGGAS